MGAKKYVEKLGYTGKSVPKKSGKVGVEWVPKKKVFCSSCFSGRPVNGCQKNRGKVGVEFFVLLVSQVDR